MVKGKTKSGISFELDERIKDDSRLLLLLTRIQQKKDDAIEVGKAMNELFDLIFGSFEETYAFMNEVASKNEGICSTEILLAEITEMFNAIQAKN